MFFIVAMQGAFDFGGVEEIGWLHDQLKLWLGRPVAIVARSPIGQLVKSSISSRTRDEVSLAAYERLVVAYPEWRDLAQRPAVDVEAIIGDVTFPDAKARHLVEALGTIAAARPDFDLAFLASLGVSDALAWLERLPGVGRKVAASTLNFSTLSMPAFVVDTHVLRVLRRFGLVRLRADTLVAYETVMGMAAAWNAAELAELHVLIKTLGQTICRVDLADCRDCPIRQRCKTAAAFPPSSAAIGGASRANRNSAARRAIARTT